ncbi:MAG: YlxM family DNA-binding protein [Bacillota bacterium]
MERFVFINLLYDFYGQMLTKRQRQAVELYYQLDLSLSEIAAELSVSRQAVHDLLKRSEEALEQYELRLGLVERWSDQQTKIKELRQLLEALADEQEQRWQQVFALLGELTQ